jgi:hypothetical protein
MFWTESGLHLISRVRTVARAAFSRRPGKNGAIKRREAQVRIEADQMFLRVQNLVDTSSLCSLLK